MTELKSLVARMVSIAEETNIANGGSSLEIGDIIEDNGDDGFYHSVEVFGDLRAPLVPEA